MRWNMSSNAGPKSEPDDCGDPIERDWKTVRVGAEEMHCAENFFSQIYCKCGHDFESILYWDYNHSRAIIYLIRIFCPYCKAELTGSAFEEHEDKIENIINQ